MIVVLLIAIAAACAWLAQGKGRSPALWFALGLLFSLIALIIIACLQPAGAREATTKLCPDCGETVPAAARLCRFCRHEFDESEIEPGLPPITKPTLWQKLFWNPHAGR